MTKQVNEKDMKILMKNVLTAENAFLVTSSPSVGDNASCSFNNPISSALNRNKKDKFSSWRARAVSIKLLSIVGDLFRSWKILH